MNRLVSLTALLGERCCTDADTLQRYGLDWTRFCQPAPLAVLFPQTQEEVQEIVRIANREGLQLVPSGGRTGLSGGACATAGEVVVSLERMNRLLAFDATDRLMTVEAGMVTETLQQLARERGLYFPVDFASRGSSQVGGNVATNAGGIRVLRYGMFRDWVAGLTVVTGAGELLQLNHGLVKNNTGYDLRHLFVGSEGTLGLVTAVTLKLARPPAASGVMLFAVPQLADVMTVLARFRQFADPLAFEFFSDAALAQVEARGHVASPFEGRYGYYALVEYERITPDVDEMALTAFAGLAGEGVVADAVLAQSDEQARQLWRLREDISESITPRTPYKNDIAVHPSQVPAFVAELDTLLAREYPGFEVVWFGHIGDGNLHVNVLRPPELTVEAFRQACERVNALVFGLVAAYNGSMSAEHGVGLLKAPYLAVSRSPEEIALMRGIKAVFDPRGVMNPGKLIA
ncbi:FAD-binding oxidoreductase [Laribacter hongkongensis]|uniref:FAD-binding oxidoreductase n=1 Tax=Laribacter hongkongensis TaxID=168471 RepID=UPI001EFE57C6|nr:FAD-binding oxidoreductase [Laribacter hongkongensis]MCG9053436.1 FAD-binding oxidoreductase [Laribacter hongkongensis]